MSPIQIISLSVIYVLAINLVAMLAFTVDKSAARRGRRRIRESTLLMIAFIGGSIGSITAQHLIRHKTQKQPFKSQLYTIALLQVMLIVALCIPDVRALISSTISSVLSAP
jgi:uncharacterized membrane protein YsdA (DUF1294 family)